MGIFNGLIDTTNIEAKIHWKFTWNFLFKLKWLFISLLYTSIMIMMTTKKIIQRQDSTSSLFDDNLADNADTTIQYLPRFLFNAIVILFISENFFNWIHFNWLSGSKLIKHLANMAILNVDRNVRLGLRIIICYLIIFVMVAIFSFVIYNQENHALSFTEMIIRYIVVNLYFFTGHYQCCIFAYIMIIYRHQIYEVRKRYAFMSRFHFFFFEINKTFVLILFLFLKPQNIYIILIKNYWNYKNIMNRQKF